MAKVKISALPFCASPLANGLVPFSQCGVTYATNVCNLGTPSVMSAGSGTCSIQGTGCNNNACGNFSFVGGGGCNTISGLISSSFIGGGHCNNITASVYSGGFNVISGGICNTISACYGAANSFIGGGCCNTSSGDSSNTFIGGGSSNNVCGCHSAIVGGCRNTASGYISFIGGGRCNIACENNSAIVGGCRNTASGYMSFIGGGGCNNASGYISFIGGGAYNTTDESFSIVAGGLLNTASAILSTIGGGYCNIISFSGSSSTISGGEFNKVCGYCSFIGGGQRNNIAASAGFACYNVITGGRCNTISGSYTTYASVGGGFCNTASGSYSFIGGGSCNTALCNYTGVFGCNICNTVACSFAANQLWATNLTGGTSSSVCVGTNGVIVRFASDERLKTNICNLGYGLCEVKQLTPVSFDWNEVEREIRGCNRQIGFIAQQVEPIIPEAVGRREDNGEMSLSPDKIIPVLTKALQELSSKFDAQETRIAELENIIKRNNLI